MPQACKVCSSEHKAEMEAAMGVGATLATISTLFNVTEASAGRHRRGHLARVEVAARGEHLQAADAMIEQARSTRTFDSYDEAEATYLRTIAVALDAKPENPSILAEFRRTLASFRPQRQQSAPDEQMELAQLIAGAPGHRLTRAQGTRQPLRPAWTPGTRKRRQRGHGPQLRPRAPAHQVPAPVAGVSMED